ncbi:MAG: NFACT RNA binding domain-containing protein [Candidatus Eisenbacteria bacterium]
MDDHVLEHAALALRKRLVSPLRVEGTDRMGERAFALVVDDGGRRSRLVLDVDPAHATLHLEPVPKREEWRGGFGQRLRGAFLVDARFVPGDRRVELDLAVRTIQPTFRIEAAWHGRGGNLWLLDLGGPGSRPGTSPTTPRVLERLVDIGPAPDEEWTETTPPEDDGLTAGDLAAHLARFPLRRWVRELAKRLRISRPAAWQALHDALTNTTDPSMPTSAPLANAADPSTTAADVDWERVLGRTQAGATSSHAYRLSPSARLSLRTAAFSASELGLPEAWVSIGALPAFAAHEVDRAEGAADPKEDAGRLFWLLSRTYRHLTRVQADTKRRQAYETRVRNERRRIERIGESLRSELSDEEGPMLRTWGEAILSHLHQVKKGDTLLTCPNLHDPDGPELSIPLDPARSATDVAESYFKRARRWQKGKEMRETRLGHVERALAGLDAFEQELSARTADAAQPDAEPNTDSAALPTHDEVEARLKEAIGPFYKGPQPDPAAGLAGARPSGQGAGGGSRGRGGKGDLSGAGGAGSGTAGGGSDGTGDSSGRETRGPSNQSGRGSSGRAQNAASQRGGGTQGSASGPGGKRGRDDSKFRPRTYTTSDGWTVIVGRTNVENDYVTMKVAKQDDYWFHAHGVPGSHVVLKRDGRKDNPSRKTIEEAAAIAAFYSKARNSGRAPVIYTLKKYVTKPRKAKAGLVMCTRETSIMVKPMNPEPETPPEWED